MNSLFDQAINAAAASMMQTFGIDVFINGFADRAIYTDDETEGGVGYQREVMIEILPTNADYYAEGDSVYIGNDDYVINHIEKQTTENPFIRIELKRA